MTTPVRWALVGPGGFADYVVPDLQAVEGATVVSVYGRRDDAARDFARRHGIGRSTSSYDELLDDPEVDAVYIVTPHSTHAPLGIAALEAGKHVLSEKAFACSAAEAADYVEAARRSGRFLMEGMWTLLGPVMQQLRTIVDGGTLGDVRHVRSQLGVRRPRSADDRWWRPELGGGALLELGVYPIAFVTWVLGPPDEIDASGTVTTDGVDVEATAVLRWASGATATVATSMLVEQDWESGVHGTLGAAIADPPVYSSSRLTVRRAGLDDEVIAPPIEGHGYVPMFRHATECIRAGLTESPTLHHRRSLDDMRVVDEIRRQLTTLPEDLARHVKGHDHAQ